MENQTTHRAKTFDRSLLAEYSVDEIQDAVSDLKIEELPTSRSSAVSRLTRRLIVNPSRALGRCSLFL